MEKLLIIDANSILNRAFYGIRNLTAKDGTPTNAVYGFLNILLKLINDVQPDYICTAFDVKAPTFRHKQFKEYKAQRKPMPDALAEQMPISKEILSAMQISILEKEGYEADDIIGTVASMCENKDIECYIATGDKDDLQLATDKTKVILTVTRSGFNETVVYDDKAVKEKYNVTPTEFIDVKALMGDPSDNIPGVAGVGEKTAFSLISKYNSIEYIYDNIDEVGLKGAMLKKIIEGKDMAFLSKQLATIDKNVPIEVDFSSCKFNKDEIAKNDDGTLFNILKKLDLNSLIKKLSLEPKTDVVSATQVDVFKDMVAKTVNNADEFDKLIEDIKKADTIACKFYFLDKDLSGFCVAINNLSTYVGINSQITKKMLIDKLSPILADENVKKIVFDIKDTLVKLKSITPIKSIIYDVAIAAYLIDPARADYNFASVVMEYLGVELEANKTGQISLFDDTGLDTDLLCKEAICILHLKDATEKLMEEKGQSRLYYDVELPLIEVLADMQFYGFKIDQKQLQEFTQMISEKIDLVSKEIFDYAGEDFNLNSPKQLGVILFEKMGLKSVKKTKTGYSTNAEVLEKLKDEHPIIEKLMEYRQLSKLKSTYCEGLKAVISPNTGRIHSVFNQTVTVTGRISSTEPNMQNIPTRTELGRELRKMFIAEGKEYTLIDADYSQIELRVLAHIANDEVMINAFLSNEDIHSVTASQVFNVPLSEVTNLQRSSAKAVNFGIVYGIGEFSLSKDLNISVAQAKEYINNYLTKYNGVHEYMENIKEQAKKDGYIKTMLNRIRYIPELKSSNFNVRSFGERVALNTPIQGTAADIIKLAMVRVHNRLKNEGAKSRLILQVHDELIIEAYLPEVEKVKEILKTEMEGAMKLSVPLLVDMSEGKSWYDAK